MSRLRTVGRVEHPFLEPLAVRRRARRSRFYKGTMLTDSYPAEGHTVWVYIHGVGVRKCIFAKTWGVVSISQRQEVQHLGARMPRWTMVGVSPSPHGEYQIDRVYSEAWVPPRKARGYIQEAIAQAASSYYSNGWMLDPIHPDIYPFPKKGMERMLSFFEQELADLPWEFKVTCLQRRYLYYVSDGNFTSQRCWLGGVKRADVRWLSDISWGERMSHGAPVLYVGPAWSLQFLLNDMDVLGNCRVFLKDDGTLIQSDWCQRNGVVSSRRGIDLAPPGVWTLSSWIMGPLMSVLDLGDRTELGASTAPRP